MDLTTFFFAVLATSIAAGTVGAILGLGGGILLVPVLTLFFGVDLHYAMGASIISVIATSSGAAASYLRTGLSNVRIGLFLVLATISGALAGASLSGVAPVRWLELILGLALGYSAFTTVKQIGVELPDEMPGDWLAMRFGLEGTYYDRVLDREVKYRAVNVGRGFGAMFVAGILSGLLGIGSGAFKVLAMDYFMRIPMKVSTATSNFMIGLTAAASAGVYFARGDIHPLIVAPVAIGVLLGAYIGTTLIAKMRNTTVRKVFLPIVIYLALSMFLRGLGVHLL
ncbi:MAG TPA: sulfite exporter TauE/SafE family protein [Candidatus Methylomirabilis sp.]|nr:sulfite exporter TauE/SafE family protein [Candidatus Methylomirabilis sp.]